MDKFIKIKLDTEFYFNDLLQDIKLEPITQGRNGAILCYKIESIVPIVRSTTKYKYQNQTLNKNHEKLKSIIENYTKVPLNNAMIEVYTDKYTTMNYHSDQNLDLEKDSYICLYSCYNNTKPTKYRTLMIKNKETNEEYSIEMEPNTVIIFSIDTNSKWLHKIVLENQNQHQHKDQHKDQHQDQNQNMWLGITFRTSKTLVKFIEGVPYIRNSIGEYNVLTLATKDQEKEYYKLRSVENKSKDFYNWPENINYTISPSDIVLCDDIIE